MMLCMQDILKHDVLTDTGCSIKQSAMDKGYINTIFLDKSTEMARILVRAMYDVMFLSKDRLRYLNAKNIAWETVYFTVQGEQYK